MDPSMGSTDASPSEETLNDQQVRLETEVTRLARRVHRLQGRLCQRHIAKHVQAFVRHHQSVSGIGCTLKRERPPSSHSNGKINSSRKQQSTATSNSTTAASPNVIGLSPAEEKMRILNQEGVKSLSTSELVNLVKQLEHNGYPSDSEKVPSSTPNATVSVNNSTSNGDGSNDATHASPVYNKNCLPTETKYNSANSRQINDTRKQSTISASEAKAASIAAGQLKANLDHLEEDYDSDATESSSGGESCDDGFSFAEESGHSASNNNSSNNLSTKNPYRSQLKDNLSWRWAVERGAIASRWMWLVAQVHDLELKIRQQNEVYRTLRSNKGSIIIEPRSRGANNQASTAICNSNSSSRSALPLPPPSSTSPAATSVPQPSTSTTSIAPITSEDSDSEPSSCVRTMPLRVPRRRQLVRANVVLASATRKIARQTTVQCSCGSLPSLVSPCVLCNGRYSYVQVIDTNCMPQNERIAILDPSCHSVLTLPYQISLGLHFSKFLKKETIPKNHTSVKKKKALSNSEKSVNANNKGINNSSKGSSSNIQKSQTVISKLKKKYEGQEKKRGRPPGPLKSKSRERRESSSNGSADSSRHGSPLPSPLPAEPAPRRRRSDLQHAYDIDNIVIPYHMACAPRIEKPQYKEIITPKWREIDITSVKVEMDDEMLEDLSDASFAERHLRCEMEEKRRFLLLCAMGKRRVSTEPSESENHEQKAPLE